MGRIKLPEGNIADWSQEQRDDYTEKVRREMAEDQKKHEKLQQQIAEKQKEVDAAWFFKGSLKAELKSLQATDNAVVGDLGFNAQNLEATLPPEPPQPPVVPTPPVQTFVNAGTKLQCTFGAAPSALVVARSSQLEGPTPMANIMDFKPMVNIMPFGMCTCPANPTVASATAAAFGVLTPMPCIPNTVAPWAPGDLNVLLDNQPTLLNTDTLTCAWGGVIKILP